MAKNIKDFFANPNSKLKTHLVFVLRLDLLRDASIELVLHHFHLWVHDNFTGFSWFFPLFSEENHFSCRFLVTFRQYESESKMIDESKILQFCRCKTPHPWSRSKTSLHPATATRWVFCCVLASRAKGWSRELFKLVVLTHPNLKDIISSNWIISPNRGENKNHVKPQPSLTLTCESHNCSPCSPCACALAADPQKKGFWVQSCAKSMHFFSPSAEKTQFHPIDKKRAFRFA